MRRKDLLEQEAKIERAIHGLRRGRLTTRYHGYIINDKSNEGRDISH